jgi:hypothetical protein
MSDGQKKLPELSSMSRRATWNDLGTAAAPAILLGLQINLAQSVRWSNSFYLHYFSPKEMSKNFAPIPGGGHGTSSTHPCSVDVARNGINYTGLCKYTSQLSFALLFSSNRAASAKRTI